MNKKISRIIRISLVLIIFIGAGLMYNAIGSDHPFSGNFIGMLQFEFGYKALSIIGLYLAARFVTGIRRHELQSLVENNNYCITAIYCTTILCLALIISFAGSVS